MRAQDLESSDAKYLGAFQCAGLQTVWSLLHSNSREHFAPCFAELTCRCKTRFRELHHFYDRLCPPCAALNYAWPAPALVSESSRWKDGRKFCKRGTTPFDSKIASHAYVLQPFSLP